MIIREVTEQDIQYLKRNKILNLNLLGFIDNNADAKVLAGKNGFALIRNLDALYLPSSDDEFLRELLDFLPEGPKKFCAVERNTGEKIFALVKERSDFEHEWLSRCSCYVLTGEFIKGSDDGYECGTLTADDAEEVNSYYTYKSDVSIYHVLENITKRDNACIRINGSLACWTTVHGDGSMGILYVKEQYRGRQLGRIVAESLMEKLIAKGKIPFVHIVEDNQKSFSLIKKIRGMEFSHYCDWFSMIKK